MQGGHTEAAGHARGPARASWYWQITYGSTFKASDGAREIGALAGCYAGAAWQGCTYVGLNRRYSLLAWLGT